jgi:hypothetical protein
MPPTKFAHFVERVPMVKGRLDWKATTATGYAWLVWEKRAGELLEPLATRIAVEVGTAGRDCIS